LEGKKKKKEKSRNNCLVDNKLLYQKVSQEGMIISLAAPKSVRFRLWHKWLFVLIAEQLT